MLSAEELALARTALAEALSKVHGRWQVDGDLVAASGTPGVEVASRCADALFPRAVHLDLGFAFNRNRRDSTVWDCAVSLADDRAAAVREAVDLWMFTTAPALFSLLFGKRVLGAVFLGPRDPLGVPGWECFGGRHHVQGDGAPPLQKYVEAAPPLPRIVDALPRVFGRDHLNGVHLFYGAMLGTTFAEVRVNGRRDDGASRALAGLDWPRLQGTALFRYFVLLARRG